MKTLIQIHTIKPRGEHGIATVWEDDSTKVAVAELDTEVAFPNGQKVTIQAGENQHKGTVWQSRVIIRPEPQISERRILCLKD